MLSLKAKLSLFQTIVNFLATRLTKGIVSEKKKVTRNIMEVTNAEKALAELKAEIGEEISVSNQRISTAERYVDNLSSLL